MIRIFSNPFLCVCMVNKTNKCCMPSTVNVFTFSIYQKIIIIIYLAHTGVPMRIPLRSAAIAKKRTV
jgi:hypothetical protein